MDDTTYFVLTLVTQLVGLTGLAAARLAHHAAGPRYGQRLFFIALLLVAAVVLADLWRLGSGWPISSVTMSVMVVGATLDLERR